MSLLVTGTVALDSVQTPFGRQEDCLGAAIVCHSNEIEAVLNRWFGFRLWDPAVYAISRIPDQVDYRQAAMIAAAAVLASLAGAALPAHRAAKLQVVDALKME